MAKHVSRNSFTLAAIFTIFATGAAVAEPELEEIRVRSERVSYADLNLDNEGPWSVTIPLVPTVTEILLREVVLDWQYFNNAGDFQVAARAADWTVTVTGSVSGELGSLTSANVNGVGRQE